MNYEALTIKPKVFETIFALCLLAMFFLIVSFLWIPIGIYQFPSKKTSASISGR